MRLHDKNEHAFSFGQWTNLDFRNTLNHEDLLIETVFDEQLSMTVSKARRLKNKIRR